ncbi:hypothetical protein LshimejAT787_1002750 [Lyophyllum shimeji]|uniref:Zn(2)-C6 fungal-type domain-containing protein n=1 Tax=Lyophyllum shimeji TaxID=47721 RepID=A0A9P3PTE5_LYOSH|nr:hypothetical protein LshimejAT787_1002750 [Lyophyllum shimeji]
MDSDLRPVSDSSPAWPRRASRACASCRRDKIRCDGARPCAGCIKKGYSADQCVDGCDPCRRARVRLLLKILRWHLDLFGLCVPIRPIERNWHARTVAEITRSVRTNDHVRVVWLVARSVYTSVADPSSSSCDVKHVDKIANAVKTLVRAEGMAPELKLRARDKIRCDGVRPCASCVRKGLECVERACKSCSREGRAADCTHRKAQAAAMSENSEAAQDKRPDEYPPPPLPEKDYTLPQPPQHRLHLPPISHPPLPVQASHNLYEPPSHMGQIGPASHYYYPPPQSMMGPGQPPQPMMQPYMQTAPNDLRRVYYPAIDPNIDNESSASGSNIYSHHSNPNQSGR